MTRYQFERTYLYERFHVSLGTRRTTISVDKTLAVLMTLKLGMQPNTRRAHLALRDWLQAHLDRNGDAHQTNVSHWLRGKLAEAIASADLSRKYDEWCIAEADNMLSSPTSQLTRREHSL